MVNATQATNKWSTLVLNAAPVKMGVTAEDVPLGPGEPPATVPDGFLLKENVVDACNVPVPPATPELLALVGTPELLTDTPGTEVTGMTMTVLVVRTVADALLTGWAPEDTAKLADGPVAGIVPVVMGLVSVTVVGVGAQ